MKKQVIALSVCLAISASTAFAVCPLTAKKNEKAPMKIEQPAPPAPGQFKNREEARKAFEAKRLEEKEAFFKKLGLSCDQKKKVEALEEKTKADRDVLVKKFRDDNKALMENSKKDFEAILTPAQKTKLEKLKAEKKAEMEKFRKEHPNFKGPKGHEGIGPKGLGCAGPKGPEPKEETCPKGEPPVDCPPPPPEDED